MPPFRSVSVSHCHSSSSFLLAFRISPSLCLSFSSISTLPMLVLTQCIHLLVNTRNSSLFLCLLMYTCDDHSDTLNVVVADDHVQLIARWLIVLRCITVTTITMTNTITDLWSSSSCCSTQKNTQEVLEVDHRSLMMRRIGTNELK